MQFVSEKVLKEEREKLGISGPRIRDEAAKPLYAQLEENKAKEEQQYKEQHNSFRPPKALDDEEVGFLNQLEQQQREQKRLLEEEERKFLDLYEREVNLKSKEASTQPSTPALVLPSFADLAEAQSPKSKKPTMLHTVVVKKATKSKEKSSKKEKGKEKDKDKAKERENKAADPASTTGSLFSLADYGSDDESKE